MSLGCMVLATNVRSRLHLLENAIQSIEAVRGDAIGEKVLSVDLFPGEEPVKYFDKFGWKVVSGPCAGRNGMQINQQRGLSALSSEYVFYSEDDIVVDRIPSWASIAALIENRQQAGRKLGFVCYNTHIASLPDKAPQDRVRFVNSTGNYLRVNGECYLLKSTVLKDEYYLNFPVAIVHRDSFLDMHRYAATHCTGLGIEPAMTTAWFGLGMDAQKDVLVYVKPDCQQRLPLTLMQFYNEANMQFWNNNQSFRHPSINNRKNSFI